MEVYIKVSDNYGNIVEIPTEEDRSISLPTLTSQFKGASGLKYQGPNGFWRALRIENDRIMAPKDLPNWDEITYRVVQLKENKRKIDEIFDETVKLKKKVLPKKCNDLIVLGLHNSTTPESIRKAFAPYGTLALAEGGKSKGYGFIRFSDFESQLKVLMKKINIDGKWCTGGNAAVSGSKLFIGGVDNSMTADDIKIFFENTFDTKVVDVFFVPTKNYAFVTFLDWDTAHTLYGESFEINGKNVFCRPAEPISDNCITTMLPTSLQLGPSSPQSTDDKSKNTSLDTTNDLTKHAHLNKITNKGILGKFPGSAYTRSTKKSKSRRSNSSLLNSDLKPEMTLETLNVNNNNKKLPYQPITTRTGLSPRTPLQHHLLREPYSSGSSRTPVGLTTSGYVLPNDLSQISIEPFDKASNLTSDYCVHDDSDSSICDKCMQNIKLILEDKSSTNEHTLQPQGPSTSSLLKCYATPIHSFIDQSVNIHGGSYNNALPSNACKPLLGYSSNQFVNTPRTGPEESLKQQIAQTFSSISLRNKGDLTLPVESFTTALSLRAGGSQELPAENRNSLKPRSFVNNDNKPAPVKRPREEYYPNIVDAISLRSIWSDEYPISPPSAFQEPFLTPTIATRSPLPGPFNVRISPFALPPVDLPISEEALLSFKLHQERIPSPDTTTPAETHSDHEDRPEPSFDDRAETCTETVAQHSDAVERNLTNLKAVRLSGSSNTICTSPPPLHVPKKLSPLAITQTKTVKQHGVNFSSLKVYRKNGKHILYHHAQGRSTSDSQLTKHTFGNSVKPWRSLIAQSSDITAPAQLNRFTFSRIGLSFDAFRSYKAKKSSTPFFSQILHYVNPQKLTTDRRTQSLSHIISM